VRIERAVDEVFDYVSTGPLGARLVKRGVDANFATLRQILEAKG
jgi:hypothetical protein